MGLGGFLLDLAGAGSLIFRPPAPTYTVTAGPDGLALVPSANARWCALPQGFAAVQDSVVEGAVLASRSTQGTSSTLSWSVVVLQN